MNAAQSELVAHARDMAVLELDFDELRTREGVAFFVAERGDLLFAAGIEDQDSFAGAALALSAIGGAGVEIAMGFGGVYGSACEEKKERQSIGKGGVHGLGRSMGSESMC